MKCDFCRLVAGGLLKSSERGKKKKACKELTTIILCWHKLQNHNIKLYNYLSFSIMCKNWSTNFALWYQSTNMGESVVYHCKDILVSMSHVPCHRAIWTTGLCSSVTDKTVIHCVIKFQHQQGKAASKPMQRFMPGKPVSNSAIVDFQAPLSNSEISFIYKLMWRRDWIGKWYFSQYPYDMLLIKPISNIHKICFIYYYFSYTKQNYILSYDYLNCKQLQIWLLVYHHHHGDPASAQLMISNSIDQFVFKLPIA